MQVCLYEPYPKNQIPVEILMISSIVYKKKYAEKIHTYFLIKIGAVAYNGKYNNFGWNECNYLKKLLTNNLKIKTKFRHSPLH